MRIIIGILFLTLCCFDAFASTTQAKQVNFLNWGSYIPPAVITQFEQKTGITVNQTYFSGSAMLKAILLAGSSNYDVVVPALVDLQQEIPDGLFQPLHKNWLPNLKYSNKSIYRLTAKIDPHNNYAVIYQYGTTGIGYNVKLIHKYLGPHFKFTSWKQFFNPKILKKLQRCGISIVSGEPNVYGITLHYLGLSPNPNSIADYQKATQFLIKNVRPYLTYFSSNRYIFDLASGNLCLVMGYSGDVIRAQEMAKAAHNGVQIKYVIPKDGTAIWFDMLAIPKNAPHPRAAHQFINYLLQPKVMAQISNYLYQPNGVAASKPYLLPLLQQPDVSPPPSVFRKLFIQKNPLPALQLPVSQLWFKVLYGVDIRQ